MPGAYNSLLLRVYVFATRVCKAQITLEGIFAQHARPYYSSLMS